MVSALEKPGLRKMAAPITVEMYHQLYKATGPTAVAELFEGVMIEKMPKSPLHSAIVVRLLRWILAHITPEWTLRQEQPLTTEHSELEPDLAVVAARPDDYASAHPSTALWVVEVALSSLEYDREKAAVYARAGVAHYWIINVQERTIEIYSQPQRGSYQYLETLPVDKSPQSPLGPYLQLDL